MSLSKKFATFLQIMFYQPDEKVAI